MCAFIGALAAIAYNRMPVIRGCETSPMRYAHIALNVPVHSTFTYHVPPELAASVKAGSLVRVEFGVAMQPGIVIGFSGETEIPVTKPVIEALDPHPALNAAALELAQWLSETCLSPIGACVWLFLPPGFTGRSDRQYTFIKDSLPRQEPQQAGMPGAPEAKAPSLERLLLHYLRDRGPRRLRQLKSAFPKQPVESELARLEAAGMIRSESVLAPAAARKKTTERVHASFKADEIEGIVKRLRKSTRQADLLELIAKREEDALTVREALDAIGLKTRAPLNRLIDAGLVFIEPTEGGDDLIILEAADDKVTRLLSAWRGEASIRDALHAILQFDPAPTRKQLRESGISAQLIKRLAEAGVVELREEQVFRDSLRDMDYVPRHAPRLTNDQAAAWGRIESAMHDGKAARFLLHGVTGSGKTEIYLRAIAETLRQGRQAIFLVPEIALTPQTIRRVAERFPGQVAIVHGSLPIGERYDTWQRSRSGAVDVVVGTRSALFTPLPNIGLIALDEEHDGSYKQAGFINQPAYHARDVAEAMMRAANGGLILGSATPDLGSWRRAQTGRYQLLRLPKRIMGHRQRIMQQSDRAGVDSRYETADYDAMHIGLPPVSVVDMRLELSRGNRSMFSRDLRDGLHQALDRGEQAMLLLNRRGQASYIFCRDCGYVLACERCDSPMTYHRVDGTLRCHHCGASGSMPRVCPNCDSTRIRHFGAGTQQVEAALERLAPGARLLRWDRDTAHKPEMHGEILRRFIDREADILIGTQMIAKGLDLPLVTLVGVVSADLGLALPDFRAGERVFQLLTQVAGRAGRGLLGGKVILQTYQPENYVIQAASRHDFGGFVAKELAYREALGYPPYRKMARIVFSDTDAGKAEAAALRCAEAIREIMARPSHKGSSLIGPAPCFFARIDRRYRWHVLVCGDDPRAVLRQLTLKSHWQVDLDPIDVL